MEEDYVFKLEWLPREGRYDVGNQTLCEMTTCLEMNLGSNNIKKPCKLHFTL